MSGNLEALTEADLTARRALQLVLKLRGLGCKYEKIDKVASRGVGWASKIWQLQTLDVTLLEQVDISSAFPVIPKVSPSGPRLLTLKEAVQVASARSAVQLGQAKQLVASEFLSPPPFLDTATTSLNRLETTIPRSSGSCARLMALGEADKVQVARLGGRALTKKLRFLASQLSTLADQLDSCTDPNRWHPQLQEWLRSQGAIF